MFFGPCPPAPLRSTRKGSYFAAAHIVNDQAPEELGETHHDVVLVGGGVMSANLGALLKRLDPSLNIQLFEAADEFGQESSDGWHNAGTGHAGICELSYTPNFGPDGEVDIAKAVSIFEEYERSLQFWGSAVRDGMVDTPSDFINPVPHLSFVFGQEQVDLLASRFRQLKEHHFFAEMEHSEDRATIAKWAPLLVEGRGEDPLAATKMDTGTDVNFGALARRLIAWLDRQEGCGARPATRVTDLDRTAAGWELTVRDEAAGDVSKATARFVFIGAGGGSLHLLQKSGIPEAKGYGGFPIAGQWLVTDKPELVERHNAKVYGAALGAAPTMAAPHLDTRIIDGEKSILFGPFGSWTTKFLSRGGSRLDLPRSIRPGNLWTLIKTGFTNVPLVSYLVGQSLQGMGKRMRELRNFYPDAKTEEWRLIDAGIRVQVIRSEEGGARIVHFGTQVLADSEKTIAALLGASPGASVCVHIMLGLIEECFPHLVEGEARERLLKLIPTYDRDLAAADQAEFFAEQHKRALAELELV